MYVPLPRLADVVDILNTQKQIKRCNQNEEIKNHVPNEKTGENSRKVTKQKGGKQPTTYRVQNNDYKDTQRN